MITDEEHRQLFGDKEAKAAYQKAQSLNSCPLPPKPEPGLLERFEDLEREVQRLNDDLWGNAGRYPYPHATVHADKAPHRYRAGRAAWIDWHRRREEIRDAFDQPKVPLLHRIELHRYRLVARLKEKLGL